jgi:hypothetical protein
MHKYFDIHLTGICGTDIAVLVDDHDECEGPFTNTVSRPTVILSLEDQLLDQANAPDWRKYPYQLWLVAAISGLSLAT